RVATLPLIGSLLIGGAVALFVALRGDPPAWLALGALVAALVYLVLTRRDRRRRRLAREPFPEPWREVLQKEVGFYRRLSAPDQRRFEREVRFFLDEQLVTGPRGAAIDDDLRVLVAASAV